MPTTTASQPTVRLRRSRRALVATAVVGLGALTRCSFAADVDPDAPAPSTTPARTADPEPAATSQKPSAPAAGTSASTSGGAASKGPDLPTLAWWAFGGAYIGMTPAEASEALGVELVPLQSQAVTAETRCGYLEPAPGGRLPDGFPIMATGPGEGTVARVDVEAGPYRSDRGVGIGDDLAAVRVLQPTGVQIAPAPYGDGQQVTVTPPAEPGSAEVYDIDADGKVTAFHAGKRPEATYSEGCS